MSARRTSPTVRQLSAPHHLPGPLRRARVATVLVAILVVLAAIVVPGTASAATTARQIDPQVGAYLYIHDSDVFSDENQLFDMSYIASLVVSPSHLVSTLSSQECTGGEVRVVYDLRAEYSTTSPGWAWVTLSAKLYEGASCRTTDLDGTASTSFWIGPDATEGRTLTVHNDDEGGDYAKLHVTFTNTDWRF